MGGSKEVVNTSRPESIRKSPGAGPPPGVSGEDGAGAPEEAPAPEVIMTPVPTQTIFMQSVEFLLEVKAMPVSCWMRIEYFGPFSYMF